MKIEKGMVVTIEYTLKDQQGTVWESSNGDEPWVYLHGFGGIIPGLEPELEGKQVGDQLQVTLSPEQAYGAYEHDLANTIPRSAFSDIENLHEGMRLSAQTNEGETHTVVVTQITEDTVTIDANHPLAGQSVLVDIEVKAIRPATADELNHGHAHVDGHCH
jgi:FKBP-type peptidyl-prolyl cis-trans isomerase SlyD